ncbi:MAG: hypothetical protein FJX73_00890 [Armatimonadetes bacterium]|nr:hypothetical protein [Armatimonadota bacterium]
MSDALRLAVLIVSLVTLATTVRQHAAYLGGRRQGGFFAHLETAGWLILTLAFGATAFRPDLWILGVSTAPVGALCILVRSMLRALGRA